MSIRKPTIKELRKRALNAQAALREKSVATEGSSNQLDLLPLASQIDAAIGLVNLLERERTLEDAVIVYLQKVETTLDLSTVSDRIFENLLRDDERSDKL